MKTADIERHMASGTHMAVGTGYGTVRLGQEYGVSRAKVLDVRQEREKQVYRGGYDRVAHDGVLIELMEPDGTKRSQDQRIVLPRDMLGTWDEHHERRMRAKEAAQAREASRAAERERFAAAVAKLEDVLGEPLPRDRVGVDGFAIDLDRQQLCVRDAVPIERLAALIEDIWDQVPG